MEIAVVGAGNTGSTFALIFNDCGHSVRLIEILKARVDLINSAKLCELVPS